MSVMLSAASALDWVARLTGESDLPRLGEAARQRGLTHHSPLFLPYLSGERTPHNDPHARGVFFGISADTSAADLTGAVLEGVALAFADGLEVLVEKGGSVAEISVTGGGARLPYWGQLLAAALNRPLTYRHGSEVGAALGAARLARLALGGERVEQVSLRAAVPAFEERFHGFFGMSTGQEMADSACCRSAIRSDTSSMPVE
jgi:xylulokinase